MNNQTETNETEITEKAAEKESFSFSELIYDIIEVLALTTCAVLLVFTFICRLAIVDGDSMNNTLDESDLLIVSDIGYTPRSGDIVVFALTDEGGNEKSYVKRVIAAGGQVIDIDFDSWTVTVDGAVLDESAYANFSEKYRVLSDYEYPLTVPEGHVFVMGDNRNNSLDSRSELIGCVDERLIFGRVICRIYPLDSLSIYKRFPVTEE